MYIAPLRNKRLGHAFTNVERLCIKGHRICGRTAWRLHAPEIKKPYSGKVRHHAKYALGKHWIRFGNRDLVTVQLESVGTTGAKYVKQYQRSWFLPFLVLVWVGQRFETHNTLHWLKRNLGLNVGHAFGLHLLEWGIFNHWGEVKEYLMKVHGLNLEEYFTRHDRNTKFAEEVRDDKSIAKMSERLEAANLVERGLGRIISIVAEIEKKNKTEDEATATQNKFLEKLDAIEANQRTD